MIRHIFKLEPYQNGSYWYCNDPALCGVKGQKWHLPARLLGLTMEYYLSLLVAVFNAEILGWDGNTLIYGFKSLEAAKRWCDYINYKSKLVGFMV